MKTKKYLKYLVAGAVTLSLASCDDYLDLKPISDNTTANAYRTGSDAEAALIGAYDTFHQEYYVWDNIIFSDVMSDNYYAGGDNPEIFAFDNLTVTPTNNRLFNNWSQLYNGIQKANVVLQKVPGIATTAAFTEERKKQILGEASFLRAYHYYQLVKLWGDVPLVLESGSTDPVVINVSRATQQEVYNQIVADLELAVTNLPDSYGSADEDKARVTKGAANALLAKAWAQRTDRDYDKVLEYANAVINSPAGYELVDDYDDLFDGNHYNNSESILEVQYSGSTEANWGPGLLLPPSMTGDSWRKFVTPSHNLVEAFDAAGDEERKNTSILFENAPWADEFWSLQVNGSVPFAYKWKTAKVSTNRQYILRLADIILLKAEALNELNRLEEAADALDLVRERVGLDPTDADTKEEMKQAILNERRLELAQEAQRWDDLKRYGVAVEVMNDLVEIDLRTGTAKDYNMTTEKLLLPIPQSERNRNPNLGQNPGYN